jgi:hypothetical protein
VPRRHSPSRRRQETLHRCHRRLPLPRRFQSGLVKALVEIG